MDTYSPRQSEIKREWRFVNADGEVLGRLASKIALLLQGKDKAYFVSHLDCGDYVVVTNASKVKITGRKAKQKIYVRHSGYPGGFRKIVFEKQMEKDPTKVIRKAVFGMLPDNKLKSKRLARLKIFAGEENPYKNKKFSILNSKF
jgi:large subunit ribosomal protein L13